MKDQHQKQYAGVWMDHRNAVFIPFTDGAFAIQEDKVCKSQEEFLNFLNDDNHFKNKKITLGSAEKMTDPQTVAKVRDFFKNA
ncbi:MAG: hypothetical protein IPN60_08450 [Saprospiraceae bacterium]|nr:hypothetical protein [Candidatus Opimibacter skivensis]